MISILFFAKCLVARQTNQLFPHYFFTFLRPSIFVTSTLLGVVNKASLFTFFMRPCLPRQ